jgi:tape measure domain-containing protein
LAKTTLDVAIRVKGKNELETLIKRMDVLEKEVGQLNGKLPKATNNVRKFGGASKQASDGVRSLTKNMARLAAGAGFGLFAKSAFGAAANVENLQARTNILTTEFAQLDGIQQVAAQSADRLKLANSEVLASYIDLGNRLGEQGTSLNDIQQVYEGLNTVLVKNKSSTQEAASATLQLNQALGAGRLAGEEFRAVNEAAPQVISEIAKVLGVARGEVKQLAADGAVSSKVVIQALTNINKKGAAQLEAGFTGAFGAQREFNKALTEFRETVGAELLPALTPLIKALTELLTFFGQLPGPIKTATIAVTGLGVAALIAAPALGALGSGLVALGSAQLGAAAAGVGKLTLAFTGLKVAMLALPWVALAAGVAALGVAMYQATERQRELNALINDGAGTTQQLTDKKAELEQRLQAVRGKLDGTATGIKATGREAARLRKEAALLQGQLTNLAKTYTIRLDLVKRGFGFDEQGNASSYTVNGITYDAVSGKALNPPQTVSQIIESKIEPLDTATKDKGGGGKPRESQAPQLNQELAATQKLLDLNRQLLDAQLEGNTGLIQQLEATKILAEYENDLAAIELEKIPAVEKELKGKIALAKAMGQQAELANTIKTGEKERLGELNQLLTGFDREIALSKEKGDYAKQIKQIEFDILDLREQGILKTPEEVAGYRERATAAAGVNKQLTAGQQMLSDSYDIVSGELTNSISGLIDGTKEWGDVLSDIAGQLGKMFLNQAFSGIGGLLGFAEGGRPPTDQVSIIGEKGPELFIPDSAGTILSNNDSKAALSNYNRMSPDEQKAADRGEDPMSSGASAAMQPIRMDTRVINGVEYATVAQMQEASRQAAAEGAKQGAKIGEAQTLRRLRMNPSVRRQVGV